MVTLIQVVIIGLLSFALGFALGYREAVKGEVKHLEQLLKDRETRR